MTKAAAHRLVRQHLRRPKRCQQCKREGRIVGHHYLGYAPENALKVRWLCALCHGAADHREVRKTADPDKMARVIIEVDSQTHQQLRIKALEVDEPLSAIGRQLFDEWLGGKKAAQQEGAKQ